MIKEGIINENTPNMPANEKQAGGCCCGGRCKPKQLVDAHPATKAAEAVKEATNPKTR